MVREKGEGGRPVGFVRGRRGKVEGEEVVVDGCVSGGVCVVDG